VKQASVRGEKGGGEMIKKRCFCKEKGGRNIKKVLKIFNFVKNTLSGVQRCHVGDKKQGENKSSEKRNEKKHDLYIVLVKKRGGNLREKKGG